MELRDESPQATVRRSCFHGHAAANRTGKRDAVSIVHTLTPVFARDAAGERQSVRLGHHLIPPDGFVMAAAPQRAGSLVVPSPRALAGGERSGSGAARHLNVDRELSGVVVELDRASCSSGEL